MNQLTQEWIDKAEGDFAKGLRESRVRKDPNYDSVCFHAQQCVEKYLKGKLQEENIKFPKTHDLEKLLDLLLPIEPTWETIRPKLNILTTFGVDFRYPGISADKPTAKQAVQFCTEVRSVVRSSFGLPI
jgi:HEPN domain-containing protein